MSFIQSTESVAESINRFQGLPLGCLPHSAAIEIFKRLDATSLEQTRAVSKQFRDQSNDLMLWRLLIIRHFGIHVIDPADVANTDYKTIYYRELKRTSKFIQLLPKYPSQYEATIVEPSDEFPFGCGPFRKVDLTSAPMIFGRLFPQDFNRYIESLSRKELCEAFVLCAEFGNIPLLDTIMKHPRYMEIPVNDEKGIAGALRLAASRNHIKVMRLILEDARSYEILPENRDFGLSCILAETIANKSAESCRLIMEHPGFQSIQINGPLGLGWILTYSALNNTKEEIELLMSNERFAEIPANNLGYSLTRAFIESAQNDATESLKAIMDNERFVEIADRDFTIAFISAALNGKIGALKMLVNHARFANVSTDTIVRCLFTMPKSINDLYVRTILMEIIAERSLSQIWY